MAIGFGTEMGNSAMVITWPNSDGTVTISQRETTKHAMPTAIANPNDIINLVAENTIVSSIDEPKLVLILCASCLQTPPVLRSTIRYRLHPKALFL